MLIFMQIQFPSHVLESIPLFFSPSLAGLERGSREVGRVDGQDGRDSGEEETVVMPLERAAEEAIGWDWVGGDHGHGGGGERGRKRSLWMRKVEKDN